MSFFEYLNFLFGDPFSMIGLAPETFICGTLFGIPLIWTVLKISVNDRSATTEIPSVNHSPSSHTRNAA
jgi:hypothetical protein